MQDEISQVREFSTMWPDRPRVYFEEWHDPLISGIRWVSELIEIAGGRDVFAELRERRSARERVVDAAEVARRDPQIILVSWCGKPADLEPVRSRPGWDRISAVREGRVHESTRPTILFPAPPCSPGCARSTSWSAGLRDRDESDTIRSAAPAKRGHICDNQK